MSITLQRSGQPGWRPSDTENRAGRTVCRRLSPLDPVCILVASVLIPNSGPIDCGQDNTLTRSLPAAAFAQRKAVQESVRSSPRRGAQGHLHTLSPNAPALLLLACGAGIRHAGTIHCGTWSATPWWAVPVYFLQLTPSRHTLVRTPLLPSAGGNGATRTHDHPFGPKQLFFPSPECFPNSPDRSLPDATADVGPGWAKWESST